MSSIKEQFVAPKRYNTLAIALMVIGVIAIIALYISNTWALPKPKMKKLHNDARFLGEFYYKTAFIFLLVVNASMFFICALTLAWAGWQMAFRRATEAISACVPVIGVICGAILLAIVFSDNHTIYHWTSEQAKR
ncbi:MAG: hypothetical protein WDN26_06725 [Chitinophagaceae bacterium]